MDIPLLTVAGEQEDLRRDFHARFLAARPMLLRICRSVVGFEEAEDLVQETYLRAVDRLGQLRDPSLFEAWLARIALNEARTFWRRRKRAPVSTEAQLHLHDGAQLRDAALVELVERLPERERACIVLHYGHGYSTQEVARLLGLSPINTRTILFRARRRLKRELQEKAHD
ncbi:MAG TPA: RNA polymerase sigma factor [Gemmatimonadaceae bacterium]